MNFLLTTYFFPIENKLELSTKLNFFIDNPRTEDEINLIKNYLEVSLDSPDEMYKYNNAMAIPIKNDNKDIISIEIILENFYKKYESDNYVNKFSFLNKNDSFLEQIAKMWIIIRFDDEGEYENLKTLNEEIKSDQNPGFIMLEDDNPILKNSENLASFTYLLSLLINNEAGEYYGGSFLLYDDVYKIREPKIDSNLNMSLLLFGMTTYRKDNNIDTLYWKINFNYIRKILFKHSEKIDNILSNEVEEKLLYISKLLKEASSVSDDRLKLITYVSILELLVTHNPDTNRFNVEDSIGKQFKTKIALLVYLYSDRKESLKNLEDRLKKIYTQRSNIAHGNFEKYKKYINSLSKKEGEEEYFDDLITDTIYYIKAILSEYIKDPSFIEFLKKN